jgi:hypothetical protein
MSDENEKKVRIGLGYPFSQLLKAMARAGQATTARVRQWERVIKGMLDGSLAVGSRTPVTETPAWVTLQVLQGGFATGGFAAGGDLLPHEREELDRLPATADRGRTALNLHFVEEPGRSTLASMLRERTYRVDVPEEAALLAYTWLLRHGESERAEKLVDDVGRFFDRLRFYPRPHARPFRSGTSVSVATAGEAVTSLHNKRPQEQVQRMKEAITVWAPLYDRAVELFVETVAATTREPCKLHPQGWGPRAQALLDDYDNARRRHNLCRKPERPKENFFRLRQYLAKYLREPASITAGDRAAIRHILDAYIMRHGEPAGARLTAVRQEQARNVARPDHVSLAKVLARRLESVPSDEGLQDLDSAVAPIAESEAAAAGAAPGSLFPASLVRKVARCWEAPLEALVEREVIGSAEAMATVVPPLTAQLRAAAIAEPELRGLYEAVYTAFRRRRSLLLLNLQSQVRLGELPWIQALEPWFGGDEASKRAASNALNRVASVALRAFPQTILPNKLIKELRALSGAAGQARPFVDELAADIFMGSFSATYLRAAQVAARLLSGSLYERYYGVPFTQVLSFKATPSQYGGVHTSPELATLCQALAGSDGEGSFVARNGTVIEQAQILTTHNLAALFEDAAFAALMRGQLPEIAKRCFEWICTRLQNLSNDWKAQLQLMKNAAYAWRQMIFYLSLLGADEVMAFVDWLLKYFEARIAPFRARFAPVVKGFEAVVAGDTFDSGGQLPSGGRRFLGWSVGRHWLLPERTPGS